MNQANTSAEQQWQQARAMLAAGNMLQAIPFLEMATAAKHPAASFNLGCLHLFSLIDTADKKRGISLIQQASELGHGGAFYQLAMLELSKPDNEPDWQYANKCLWQSARLNFPLALRTLAVLWSRSEDSRLLESATLCLEHAALAGDIVSLALLMHRIRSGIGCIQNTLRANAINTLLLQTNLPIDPPSQQVDAQFAQAQSLLPLTDLTKPDLQSAIWTVDIKVLSESPWVAIADEVLNQEECHLVCYMGAPHLKPSTAADPNGKIVKIAIRSSFDMTFSDMQEDIIVLLIQRRMAAMVNTSPAYSEYLQLLRYQNAQEYQPHRDYLPPSMITPLAQGGAGQRESTVIVYLNDVASGGETEFIELGKKIAPKTGRVVAFKNLHADGTPDTRTLHAGLPVTEGAKWIATLWIHQGVFRT